MEIKTLTEVLEKVGLTAYEAQTYRALVELGPALIVRIAEQTGLHRPTIYQALSGLQHKGLVTVSPRGKRKFYAAESPEKLRTLTLSLQDRLEKTLPDLQQLYDTRKRRPAIKFLEGKQGVKFVLDDLLHTLKRGGIYYRYSSRKAGETVERFFPPQFRTRRDAKKIQRFMITDTLTRHQRETPTMDRAYKTVPPEYHFFNETNQNIIQLVYDNKVVFADLDTVTAVLIENETIAELQRKIFKTLYELL